MSIRETGAHDHVGLVAVAVVTAVRTSLSRKNVRFNAVSNRTYTMQFKTNLNDVVWQKLADVTAGATNWSATIIDPDSDRHRFYRLVTPGQP